MRWQIWQRVTGSWVTVTGKVREGDLLICLYDASPAGVILPWGCGCISLRGPVSGPPGRIHPRDAELPGLEELREQAGGSDAQAVMAASIAMAESSGQQFATGAAGERGYWQINPDHGSLSTYDPLGNAKAAVISSDRRRHLDPLDFFVKSPVLLGRAVLPGMQARRYGRIVQIDSEVADGHLQQVRLRHRQGARRSA